MGNPSSKPVAVLARDPDAELGLFGLDSVLLVDIAQWPSTISSDPSHTRVRIAGLRCSLWYRGVLTRFAIGSRVSVIYERIRVHGVLQAWIIRIEAMDINALCAIPTLNNCISHFQES